MAFKLVIPLLLFLGLGSSCYGQKNIISTGNRDIKSYSNTVKKQTQALSKQDKIEFHYQKLATAEEVQDTLAIGLHLSNLIDMNSLMEHYDRAKELKDRALYIAENTAHPLLRFQIYRSVALYEGNRANLYRTNDVQRQAQPSFIKHRRKGVQWARKSLEVAKKYKLTEKLPHAYYSLGQKMIFLMHTDVRYLDSSRVYLQEATRWAKRTNEKDTEAGAHNWLGTVYTHDNNPSLALQHLDSAKTIIDELPGKQMWLEHNNANFVFNAFAQKAGLDTLVALKNEIIRRKTDTYAAEYQQEVADSENRYRVKYHQTETERTQQALQLEEARVNQRNLIISVIALLLVAAGGGSAVFYRLNRKNKKLAERNELLVKEQNHRVKNNLQMIASLLSLQARQSKGESKTGILDSTRRVQAIALLHRKLYNDIEGVREVNLQEYLRELVEDVIYAAGKPDIPLRLELEEVTLPVEKAVHLALIVNELVTNSLKHVFSREKLNGEAIHLTLQQQESGYRLTYSDEGGHFDETSFSQSDSFGNNIIRMQSKYLGDYRIENRDGFYYSLTFSS